MVILRTSPPTSAERRIRYSRHCHRLCPVSAPSPSLPRYRCLHLPLPSPSFDYPAYSTSSTSTIGARRADARGEKFDGTLAADLIAEFVSAFCESGLLAPVLEPERVRTEPFWVRTGSDTHRVPHNEIFSRRLGHSRAIRFGVGVQRSNCRCIPSRVFRNGREALRYGRFGSVTLVLPWGCDLV